MKNNQDIAVAVDLDGNYYRVLVWKNDDALADVTPIDKDTLEDIGEKHRESIGDLKEFYTLFDHQGNVLSEPYGEDDDETLRESKKTGKVLKEANNIFVLPKLDPKFHSQVNVSLQNASTETILMYFTNLVSEYSKEVEFYKSKLNRVLNWTDGIVDAIHDPELDEEYEQVLRG